MSTPASISGTAWDVRFYPDSRELARAAARDWLAHLTLISGENLVTAALSGGRIARAFFEALVSQTWENPMQLRKVHWFWTDERCVPPDHEESNYRLARQWLFEPIGCPGDHIHRIRGEEVPELAAAQAATELRAMGDLKSPGTPLLDLIFLGMGEDGHVASLFPGRPDQQASTEVYFPVYNTPKPPPVRISMGSFPVAEAHTVFLLVSGTEKKAVLRKIIENGGAETPAGHILARRSWTHIYTDSLPPN